MNSRDVGTLNSLVTYAAENIPGGLNSREQEVARMVGSWALDGVPVCQVCPHCGSALLHDEGRLFWFQHHIVSEYHRIWWSAKKRVERLRRR